ncbi:phenylalanyl-tRNA synthetase subunit alpha [Nitzschia inconspicua]|uniref:phenylalanine--tRNA ligase n=1 Tax=Nitzschia inconspicua TaxID=303405 RepID=A0A9K3L1P8_9STRA|nr:phenylalanyl-tRNA synthetase subunit alpha [Nitzschia inconspicua]
MTTEDSETAILTFLSASPETVIEDTYPWSQSSNLDHKTVVGAIKSLLADKYVVVENLETSFYSFTEEGQSILDNGSQEILVLKALNEAGKLSIPDLQAKVGKDVAKIGMGNCMKAKWIKKDGQDLVPVAKEDEVEDTVRKQLQGLRDADFKIDALSDQDAKDLKRRKCINLVTVKSHRVSRGSAYQPQRVKKAADLTKEMLDSGAWETAEFKPYNFLVLGEKVGGGFLHPLLKVRAEFRKILMEMGFQEMPTNKWVESSFWNFDSLFQPQSHPARDAHDTFFIKEPAQTVSVPEEYYERVKTMHEIGGAGSIGYRYDFRREEAMKNLLRTHTTAVSSQMLYKLANQPGGFKPARYFSIDRVFRNETMDATHLCEFHQVEGLVADYNLSLGDLIGTIETFFKKIGITQLRFKPAFNPYTEPSMEIFGYHPDLKKWTEIGNSGMFRPEMLQPMGLPENVRVIAWGLSLERPTMIKYRISNIRDLFGHKVEMARTQNAPICRFEDATASA